MPSDWTEQPTPLPEQGQVANARQRRHAVTDVVRWRQPGLGAHALDTASLAERPSGMSTLDPDTGKTTS